MRNRSDIRIEPQVIIFPNTYMTTSKKYTLILYNDSNEKVSFSLRKYLSSHEEKSALIKENLEFSRNTDEKNHILAFNDPYFAFDPPYGEIWAKRSMHIIVSFNPDKPGFYEAQPTLFFEPTKDRCKLQLKGTSVPPSAKFNISGINIGSVELESIMEYEVSLQNTGDIVCPFEVRPYELKGIEVEFNPSRGIIPIGESRNILVKFIASQVCNFHETFSFELGEGSNSILPFSLHGRVVGPTFQIIPPNIDMGMVTSGGVTKTKFKIQNTSKIPFDYSLSIPDDGFFANREFYITPTNGFIDSLDSEEIEIELLPIEPKIINVDLIIDISKFGFDVAKLNIYAEVIQPKLRMVPDIVDTGVVFINYPVSHTVELFNETSIPVTIQYVPCNSSEQLQASVKPRYISQIIPGNKSFTYEIEVTPRQLGVIDILCHIHLVGSSLKIPFPIKGACVGPKLEYSLDRIDFGKMNTLSNVQKVLRITNHSTIDAVYTTENNEKCFKISSNTGTISPNEILELYIDAYLNDTRTFADTLTIYVEHLEPVSIPIKAIGSTPPIVSTIELVEIDVGNIITEHPHKVRFALSNYGARLAKFVMMASKPKANIDFNILPHVIDIEPGKTVDFDIVLSSPTPQVFLCRAQILCTIENERYTLYQPIIKGQFSHPKLTLSVSKVNFVHTHNYLEQFKLGENVPDPSLLPDQFESIVVKNESDFVSNFTSLYTEPFSLDKDEFQLQPGESTTVILKFDPKTKRDMFSETIHKKVIFDFYGHSKKFHVNSCAKYVFPNIIIDPPNVIDFGMVQSETEKNKSVTITNSSELTVIYDWTILDEGDSFEILPLRGELKSGETQTTYISCFTKATAQNVTAFCRVHGGPTYKLNILSQTCVVDYTVEPQQHDFGYVLFDQFQTKQFTIYNKSENDINYIIKIPGNTKLKLKVTPQEGVVPANSKSTFQVRARSGVPGEFHERIVLNVVDFNDTEIYLSYYGEYQHIELDDRVDTTKKYIDFLESKSHSSQYPLLSSKKNTLKKYLPPPYISGIYTCDFGTLILGEDAHFEFVITSFTKLPISCSIDSSSLADTGFDCEDLELNFQPESINRIRFSFQTSSRALETTGEVCYPVYLIFSDSFHTQINLIGSINEPTIKLSTSSIFFGSCIIGRYKVINFQIQNVNHIPITYQFKKDSTVYSIVPMNGEIDPFSFTNFEVTFSPRSAKHFQSYLSLTISNVSELIRIDLQGEGQKFDIEFDPPIVECPAMVPYDKPTTATFKMINRTDTDVEIFNFQYDFKLYVEKRMIEEGYRNVIKSSLEEEINNRFSLCVIVHGAKFSGKTTICKMLQEYLDLPIINLSQVFEGLDCPQIEYISAFTSHICNVEYYRGFIIDGLDCFDEVNEITTFLSKNLRNKNNMEEIHRNPYLEFHHDDLFAYERALSYILASLHGHYLLLITLQIDESDYESREYNIEREKKRKKEFDINNKKRYYFSMDEQQYFDLTEEQQEDADKKRKHMRDKQIKHITDAIEQEKLEEEGDKSKKNKRSGSSKRDKSKVKEKSKDKNKDKSEKECKTSRKRNKDDSDSRRKKKKSQKVTEGYNSEESITNPKNKKKSKKKLCKDASDPILTELARVNLINGSLKKQMDNSSNIMKLDLLELFSDREIDDILIVKDNCLHVRASVSRENIFTAIRKFLPEFDVIKERSFEKLIPESLEGKIESAFDPNIFVKPDNFLIINEDVVFESSNTRKSGRHSRSSKRRNKKGAPIPDIPFLSELDLKKFTPRWKLSPGEEKVITIQFSSQRIGYFSGIFHFGIDTTHADILSLRTSGCCLYPNFDRSITKIFTNCYKKLTSKIKSGYSDHIGSYTFGNIIVTKDKPLKNLPGQYHTIVNVNNTTSLPCEVITSVVDSNTKQSWVIEPEKMKLGPDQKGEIIVSVYPQAPGQYKLVLALYCKDNPEPFIIPFVAEAISPTLELNPPVVEFGRVLLKTQGTQDIALTNTENVPLLYHIKKTEPFTFSSYSGTIEPQSTEVISASFISSKPIVLKKHINIDIFDSKKTRSYTPAQLTLNVEAFDGSVELTYPNKLTGLHFGTLKVGETRTLAIHIKNKGKFIGEYSVNMKSKYIIPSSIQGILNPGEKASSIVFTFRADGVMNTNNAKVGVLTVMDQISKMVTFQHELRSTACTMYAEYETMEAIDFGSLQVNSRLTRVLPLKNNGIFPLTYCFYQKVDPDKLQKGKNTVNSPNIKLRKGSGSIALHCNNFILSPSHGTIQPGHVANINVDFSSSVAGFYSAALLLDIPDTNPPEPKTICLKCDAISPSLFNDDFEKIFASTHMCLRSDILKFDTDAFLEDEQTFHFRSLPIGKTSGTEVTIMNPTSIQITVDCSIKAKGRQHQCPFDIDIKQAVIPPNASQKINLTFSPTSVDFYCALFEAVVKGGEIRGNNKTLKFQVEGTGAIPVVAIASEKVRNNQYVVGRVLIGSSKSKTIALRNEGSINANIVIIPKTNPEFELGCNAQESITIEPGRLYNISVSFNPTKSGRSVFEMTVVVQDNPKPNIPLSFVGEGYTEDVIFDGDVEDDVMFTGTVVSSKVEKTFQIRNICNNQVKFSFGNHHDFSFSPKVGHLLPGRSKTITCSFYSEKPVKYQSLKIPVSWQKIESQENIEWDDTRKDIAEPSFKQVGPKQKDLGLRVSAICDNIKYSMDKSKISFSPTMMYQSLFVEVKLTNTSNVRFEYSWECERFTALRTNYALTYKCCFRIIPKTGVIQPGQTVVFKVFFSPEEVDDFTAEFICKIPFLSLMNPPKLDLDAISKRPLCHFNVERSDYLKRRHPAYTDELPEGTYVVEVCAPSVGSKIDKKLDIINPTSMPYEVKWEKLATSNVITCKNPVAIISSGRKYSFTFVYEPSSKRTVESLWKFSIPIHNVVVHVLLVGRIVPH